MGRGGRWGREGDTEEGGGHAAVGGQLGHWLLLEQEGQRMGRQVLALPRWSPGGQQPFSSALLLQLHHGGGGELAQELVARVGVQLQKERTQSRA